MENDHLIVMVLSIVAVVGIVSMVLAGSRSIATPITFSQGSVGASAPDENLKGQATAFCIDSDGGLNYSVKGTVQTDLGISYTDACHPRINSSVVEFYCSRTSWNKQVYGCPYGCSNGACLPMPICGDGVCQATYGETYSSCSTDCVNPITITPLSPIAGQTYTGSLYSVATYKSTAAKVHWMNAEVSSDGINWKVLGGISGEGMLNMNTPTNITYFFPTKGAYKFRFRAADIALNIATKEISPIYIQ